MTHRVSDERYAALTRRIDDIRRRVDDGSLPFHPVMNLLRDVVMGDLRLPVEAMLQTTHKIRVYARNADHLLADLDNGHGNYRVTQDARNRLVKKPFPELKEQVMVRLVCAKVWELGFTGRPTTRELLLRAKQLGELCTDQVAGHARLFWPAHVSDERVWLLSEHEIDQGLLQRKYQMLCLQKEGIVPPLLAVKAVGASDHWDFEDIVVYQQRDTNQ